MLLTDSNLMRRFRPKWNFPLLLRLLRDNLLIHLQLRIHLCRKFCFEFLFEISLKLRPHLGPQGYAKVGFWSQATPKQAEVVQGPEEDTGHGSNENHQPCQEVPQVLNHLGHDTSSQKALRTSQPTPQN